jgi:hypothetical protein
MASRPRSFSRSCALIGRPFAELISMQSKLSRREAKALLPKVGL